MNNLQNICRRFFFLNTLISVSTPQTRNANVSDVEKVGLEELKTPLHI